MRRPARAITLAAVLATVLVTAAAGAATITVDTAVDSTTVDGMCSLREAMQAANSDGVAVDSCALGTGDDRIVFALTLPAAIVLGSDLPPLTESVAILGPGHDLEIDGADSFRAFRFDGPGGDGGFVRLADLTVRRAFLATQGGSALLVNPGDWARLERVLFADNQGGGYGGAVDLRGVPTAHVQAEIIDCTFDQNVSTGFGGGALRVGDGTFVIAGSTFADNQVTNGNGGALNAIAADLTIVRSTFSGNQAADFGGALHVSGRLAAEDLARLEIVDTTIAFNDAGTDGDALGAGGGLALSGTPDLPGELVLRNTILAANTDGSTLSPSPDFEWGSAWPVTATGWNLIGDETGAGASFPDGTPNANGDFVGTSVSPLDPLLDVLADNGGPTLTHRPLIDAASLVIDHGSCPDAEVDQRGHGGGIGGGRIVGVPNVPDHAASDLCDIGAVERNTPERLVAAVFADGFETATTLMWSAELP